MGKNSPLGAQYARRKSDGGSSPPIVCAVAHQWPTLSAAGRIEWGCDNCCHLTLWKTIPLQEGKHWLRLSKGVVSQTSESSLKLLSA